MANVRVVRVRVPFRAPFATAAGTWTARDSWLLRLATDEGTVGWGEAVLEDEAHAPVLAALFDELLEVGLPPSPALVARAGAAGRAFRAALDGARLDVLAASPEARAAGVPTVGVNALIGALAPGEAAEAAARAVEAGFRTLKLKSGSGDTTATLLERVSGVRAAAGDGVAIRLDVNGSWDPATAAERLRMLAGFGLQYVEQPLAAGDLEAAATLRAGSGVPLAADEAVDSVAGAMGVLDAGAADVLVVKPARVGGPVATAEIALLAAERGVPVVVSSLFETGVGLAVALACAAAVPDVPGWPAAARDHGLATGDLLEADLLREPFLLREGRLRAPFAAGSGGLGVRVDEAALGRYPADAT